MLAAGVFTSAAALLLCATYSAFNVISGLGSYMFHFIKNSVLALSLVAISLPAAQAGGSVDLSLSNKSFRAGYGATMAQSGVHFDAAWLHHEDEGDMAEVGFHVVEARPSSRHTYIGVGAKLHYAHLSEIDEDVGAVGVGGFFRYSLPVNPAIGVAGYLYYAPSVLSFSDTENMINSDLRVQYSVIPSARIFAGYRYVGTRLEGSSKRYKLGSGLHLGLTIDF